LLKFIRIGNIAAKHINFGIIFKDNIRSKWITMKHP